MLGGERASLMDGQCSKGSWFEMWDEVSDAGFGWVVDDRANSSIRRGVFRDQDDRVVEGPVAQCRGGKQELPPEGNGEFGF